MLSRIMAFVVVLVMLSSAIPSSQAQALDSVTYLMGGAPQDRIVGGIVHNITVKLNQDASDVTLKAHYDGTYQESNFTTNYSWSYDNGVWQDNLYDYYMKNGSGRYGNDFCFHVAIDSTVIPGTWRWIVEVDGTEEYNQTRTVEEPVAGISMSSPTFYPRIFPYGEGTYDSWNSENPDNSSNVRTTNIGNVPLKLTIKYESFNSLFSTTNSTGTYMPGEERDHYIRFQAQKWSPRKFTVKGLINGEPQLVMTPNTISCIVAPQTSFDVVVTVARPGYDIYQMDGVTVQYKKFYASKYKDDITLDMYLTGNKSVYLSSEPDGLTFNFMDHAGEEHEEPLLLELSDETERYVRGNFTCSQSPAQNQASILAYAVFDLELEDQSATGEFTSTVVVAALPEGSDNTPIEPNMIILIVLIAVFGAIGAFLFMAHRRTEMERSRELEEMVRKKKEQARKRR